MLPPPTTTAISTPRSAPRFTSVAIASIRARSAPYSSGPIRASPDNLSSTRRKAGWRPSPSTPVPEAIGLVGAHHEALEAADDHVLAGLGRELRAELLDRLAVVAVGVHVRLPQEHALVQPLGEAALGDLGAHLLGLVLRLLLVDAELALAVVVGDVVLGHVLRPRRCDVECDLARERLEVVVAGDEVRLAVHLDERADRAARVDVALDDALGCRAPGALLGARLSLDAE